MQEKIMVVDPNQLSDVEVADILKNASSVKNTSFRGNLDELLDEAKMVILKGGKTNALYLQSELKIGFNRAEIIIEQLSQIGFLSEPDSNGVRKIFIKFSDKLTNSTHHQCLQTIIQLLQIKPKHQKSLLDQSLNPSINLFLCFI